MRGISKRFRAAAALIACTLGAGSACSSGEGGGHGGQGGSAASGGAGSSLIDEFIVAYCALTRTCCARAGLPAEPLVDCEPEVERQIDLISAVRHGRTTLIEPAFGDCVSALRSLTASCDATGISSGCSRFWEGKTPEGGACENVLECQIQGDATACLIIRPPEQPDANPLGNCRILSRGALGDPCMTSNDGSGPYAVTYGTTGEAPPLVYCDARDGLRCSFSSNVCERRIPAGGACADFDECELGLYCDVTCQPQKAAGESCTGYGECAAGTGCFDQACGVVPISATELCEGDYT